MPSYSTTKHAIGEGLIRELRKLTTHQYIHIIRDAEIAVTNEEGTPIAVLDLDDTIEIWTTNQPEEKGPIGIVAKVEYANPDFLDEIIITLHNMDNRIRYHIHEKRLFDGFGP